MRNTDTQWNMLIKFSKQIGNSFPKTINTKVNFVWDGAFPASRYWFKARNQNLPVNLVWQGSEYASELASKVKDALSLNRFKYQR